MLPAPLAVFDGFGESALMFRLLYWVPVEEILRVATDVNLAVNDSLKQAGIRIPYPKRDLHIRTGDASALSGEDQPAGDEDGRT